MQKCRRPRKFVRTPGTDVEWLGPRAISTPMDGFVETTLRVCGALVRIVAEGVVEGVAEWILNRSVESRGSRRRAARPGPFERIARRLSPIEFFVTPIALLLIAAVVGVFFVIAVKLVQWLL